MCQHDDAAILIPLGSRRSAEVAAGRNQRRCDVRSAERQLASQTAQIGVATADLYPRFSLFGTFAFESFSFSNWFSGGSLTGAEVCMFSVLLDVPGGATPGTFPNTTSEVTGTIGGFAVRGDPASDDLEVLRLGPHDVVEKRIE